uniref:Uncharacterized protein n=1 Tax=Cacopsylla melanoneura TaxID=428564 RepID=A0A8D8SKM4_9HEMI
MEDTIGNQSVEEISIQQVEETVENAASNNASSAVPSTSSGSAMPRRRKGDKNPESYQACKIKKARVSGDSYVNYKGKQVNKVTSGPDCRCRMKCYSKITEDQKSLIFQSFRELETKNEQDNHLQSLISCVEVKQRRRAIIARRCEKPDREFTKIPFSIN